MAKQPATDKSLTATIGDVLKPLKAFIHGPPASGKTTIAKRVCQRYGAHYVSVKTMIEEVLEDLRRNITLSKERAKLKGEKDKDEEDVEEEEEAEGEETESEGDHVEVEQWEEQIRDINELMSRSINGKLPDDYVVRLMRTFLAKDICQSHGYVLDGFPKTLQQAKELFGQVAEISKDAGESPPAEDKVVGEDVPGEGGGAVQIGDMVGNASANIMPDFVISLQAPDNFLCERVMMLPEMDIQGTHFDEQNMIRRLKEFRDVNGPDDTVLNFFDEAEVHPILIDTTEEGSKDVECILDYLYRLFGPPIPGFGLTAEEEEELVRIEKEQRKLMLQESMIKRQIAEETARKEYEDKMQKWAETLEQLKNEEEKIITAESEPLRSYLMKYIFPTLTRGLSEITKIKPDDPVDYLAEFLFRENPEGKMFDPSYTRSGEDLLKEHESVIDGIMKEAAHI